jgi:cobalt-precorrin 5A hydrolase
MKIALISVTDKGKNLAMKISSELEEDPTVIRIDTFHKNVKETLINTFHSYNCIIGIMATGIMIRNICKLIKSKVHDPAVLVIDENGNYVISLISGHLGGGNEFSIKIADIIAGEPIITTATDINHKLGIDSLARKYYLNIDDVSKIKTINSTLLNNEKVDMSFDHEFNFIWEDPGVKNSYNKISMQSNGITVSNGSATVKLNPKKLVVGIGSRKNIDSESVINAVKSAIKILDLPLKRIDSIATGQMKQDERGIINAALKLGVPLEIIPEEKLKNFENIDLTHSDFVKEKFGVVGVSEPSSLIAAGDGSVLLFRKTPYNGVTVAIAVSKN